MGMKNNNDLLDRLGSKDSVNADGKSSDANTATNSKETLIGADSPSDNVVRGENLIDSVADKDVQSKTESEGSTKATTTLEDEVKNPDTWTKESALKEVKKLREEAKSLRVKSKEQVEALRTEMQSKMDAINTQYEEAAKAKKKLEALEAQEADKKRNLEEKLAHRESRITEMEAQLNAIKEEYENKIAEMSGKVNEFEAEREAQRQVYQDRINQEIGNIPEKFKKFAQSMVQGFTDPREGWAALSEAKAQGLFEDKTIIVNHDVPGAKTGARISQDQIDAKKREKLDEMTSSQKIKAGLDEIRKGTPNSVYRER